MSYLPEWTRFFMLTSGGKPTISLSRTYFFAHLWG